MLKIKCVCSFLLLSLFSLTVLAQDTKQESMVISPVSFKGHMLFVWQKTHNNYFSYHIGIDRLIPRDEVKKLPVMPFSDIEKFFSSLNGLEQSVQIIFIEAPNLSTFLDYNVNVIKSADDFPNVKATLLQLAKKNKVKINFRQSNDPSISHGF